MSESSNRSAAPFREANFASLPMKDLGLTLEGTELEALVDQIRGELAQRGIAVSPHFYLSTDWGVPFPSVSVAIPFYLAHPDLTSLHGERMGHVEGLGKKEILRYLRHEIGHVVNYAYRLYEREDWVRTFGAFTQPYVEEYRPQPFSRRFVRHLPGWYAQKHPDEDWAETFAVWLTPERDWTVEYAKWAPALRKLTYCDEVMASLKDQPPAVTNVDPDEEISQLKISLEEFYGPAASGDDGLPPGIDAALRTIFEDIGVPEDATDAPRLPAAKHIRRIERQLIADVFRWTGHFPERTRVLVRHLARRAEALSQVYPATREAEVTVALVTLVTALAMNWVQGGTYMP
jgi:hypothetical protein